jgi:uncharacterized protein (TIGR00255 family)
MALQSMTGFATVSGQLDGVGWVWEIRSVNGRGLDVRLRLPEGAEALEPIIRAAVPKRLARGNVSLNLKLSRMGDDGAPVLNYENLAAVIDAAAQARTIAEASGLEVQPTSVGELLTQKWVWDTGQAAKQDWIEAAKKQIPEVVDMLVNARGAEGLAIFSILSGQVDTAEKLSKDARDSSDARNARTGGILREKVLAVLKITELADESRLAQEFNREANTLCSKSNDTDLTAIGLELKVVIDQMREQVQNLE